MEADEVRSGTFDLVRPGLGSTGEVARLRLGVGRGNGRDEFEFCGRRDDGAKVGSERQVARHHRQLKIGCARSGRPEREDREQGGGRKRRERRSSGHQWNAPSGTNTNDLMASLFRDLIDAIGRTTQSTT